MSIYDQKINTLEGEPADLSQYKGKALLVVNVASKCGLTPQYEGLEKLYNQYKDKGFEVLGFPANDFGAQEPGSNEEIRNFCERNFKVSFPMFEKAPVSGNRSQPLYVYLVENAPWKGAVGWNFEKFLVARDGKIVGRYRSKVTPESRELNDAIQAQLKAKP